MKIAWKRLLRYTVAGAIAAVVIAGAVWWRLHPVPVAVVKVRPGVVQQIVEGPGNIASRIPVTVASRITGVVTALYADQGDRVKRGTLLATLDARDLVANLAAARANLALARSNYRRDLEVFRQGYISQAAMDTTRTALKATAAAERAAVVALSYARIYAPMAGLITERDAEVGDTLVPGSPVFLMINLNTLWSATRIDETVVGRIRLGDPAQIRLRSGLKTPGRVVRIGHQADTVTRELEVDVAPERPFPRFANNEETEVSIVTGTGRGLIVPVSALLEDRGIDEVIVAQDGRAQFEAVTPGIANGTEAVVWKGLKAGALVLVKPQGIRPGERIRVQLKGS